jgi:hypothetical protein
MHSYDREYGRLPCLSALNAHARSIHRFDSGGIGKLHSTNTAQTTTNANATDGDVVWFTSSFLRLVVMEDPRPLLISNHFVDFGETLYMDHDQYPTINDDELTEKRIAALDNPTRPIQLLDPPPLSHMGEEAKDEAYVKAAQRFGAKLLQKGIFADVLTPKQVRAIHRYNRQQQRRKDRYAAELERGGTFDI